MTTPQDNKLRMRPLLSFLAAVLLSIGQGGIATAEVVGLDAESSAAKDEARVFRDGARGTAGNTSEANDTFVSATGLESADGEGGVGGTRSFTADASYQAPIICGEGNSAFAGGVGIRIARCTVTGEDVTAARVSYCDTGRAGTSCDGAWSEPVGVMAGTLTPLSASYKVQLDCPPGDRRCQVTVHESGGGSFAGEQLADQAAQAQAADGEGSLTDAMQETYTSGTYQLSMENTAGQYGGCVQQVNDGLNSDGTVYTCDGEQSAEFTKNCEKLSECLSYETTTRRWSSSCVSDVPLDQLACEYTQQTGVCQAELEQGNYTCNDTRNVEVEACDIRRDMIPEQCKRTLEVVCQARYECEGAGLVPGTLASDMKFVYNYPELTVGTISNNYWGGSKSSGQIYDRRTTFQIRDKSKISEFRMYRTGFDDWIRWRLNGHLIYVGPYGGDRLERDKVTRCVMGPSGPSCTTRYRIYYTSSRSGSPELSTSWNQSVNIDLRPYLVEGTNVLDMRVIVAGGGEGWAKFRVKQWCQQCRDVWTESPGCARVR